MHSFQGAIPSLSRVPSLYPGGREQSVQIGVKSCVIRWQGPSGSCRSPVGGRAADRPGAGGGELLETLEPDWRAELAAWGRASGRIRSCQPPTGSRPRRARRFLGSRFARFRPTVRAARTPRSGCPVGPPSPPSGAELVTQPKPARLRPPRSATSERPSSSVRSSSPSGLPPYARSGAPQAVESATDAAHGIEHVGPRAFSAEQSRLAAMAAQSRP
jgi:hypothetical protein